MVSSFDPGSDKKIDKTADEFEQLLNHGKAPRIEDFIVGLDRPIRNAILAELLAVEIQWKASHEQSASLEDYLRRFPDDVDTVSRIFETATSSCSIDAVEKRHGSDRNLLFGVLALQMDFIQRDELLEAMNSWMLNKHKQLGHILEEHGYLAPDQRSLLEALVAAHVTAHNNDPVESLESVSSLGPVAEQLESIADSDVEASLAHLAVRSDQRVSDESTIGVSGELQPSTDARFRILRPHAKGGLGEVFVAHDKELHRNVALKRIKPDFAGKADQRNRFLLEAEITGGLEHPGIVPVYGLGQYGDGLPFYAMRLIRGDNLKEAITRYHSGKDPDGQATGKKEDQRSLQFRKLLGRFIDVCDAMAYAHSRGVLHRDLKPGNIMLGKYGETLVVDWGLAKTLAEDRPCGETSEAVIVPSSGSGSAPTQAGSVLGTPQYMSPEQAEGRLADLGTASDVYSLGATLYHLLTGHPPFEPSDELVVLIRKVQAGEFARPRTVLPSVHPALEAICLKAMSKNPANRYRSPRELAADIESWLADERVAAYSEPMRSRVARWARKHRALVQTAIAVLLIGNVSVGALLVLTEQSRQAEKTLRVVAQNRERSIQSYVYAGDMRRAFRTWETGHVAHAANLLNNHRHRLEDGTDLRSWEWFYLDRLFKTSLISYEGHSDHVADLAYSPDGRRIASGGKDQLVRVWDAVDHKAVLTCVGHRGEITAVEFSPDGKMIASASSDATVRIWDATTGKPLQTLAGHINEVIDLRFGLDENTLFSASSHGTVMMWDIARPMPICVMQGHIDRIHGLAFSAATGLLASASGDKTIRLWNGKTGEPLRVLVDTLPVLGVAFHPQHRILASFGQANQIKLWDIDTGRRLKTLEQQEKTIRDLVFSHDGSTLISTGEDNTFKVWSPAGRLLRTYRGHVGHVNSVVQSPDGSRLATGSSDHTVKLWDAARTEYATTMRGHELNVSEIAFSQDGSRLVSGSWDHTVRVWDVQTGTPTLVIGRNEYVRDDQTGVATKITYQGGGHEHFVMGVAFAPNGKLIASGSFDQTARTWDPNTGEEKLKMRHPAQVASVAFSPDSTLLACGCWDSRIHLWDVATGQKKSTLTGHQHHVEHVAFSPDGKLLASASRDGTAKLWDVSLEKELFELSEHDGWVNCVEFDNSGKMLATGGSDWAVRIWDVESGEVTATCIGHSAPIADLSFSPDGRRLASTTPGGEKTVRIWDTRTGAETASTAKDMAAHSSVAFSPDGWKLAAPGHGFGIGIMDAKPSQPTPVVRSSESQSTTLQATPKIRALGYYFAPSLPDGHRADSKPFRTQNVDETFVVVVMSLPRIRTIPTESEYLKLEERAESYPKRDLLPPRLRVRVLDPGLFRLHLKGSFLRASALKSGDGFMPNTVITVTTSELPRPGELTVVSAVWTVKKDAISAPLKIQYDDSAPLSVPNRILEMTLPDAKTYNDFAWTLATDPDPALREPQRAVQLATRALELGPKVPDYWNTVGVARYRSGQWDEAIAALEESIRLSGGTAFAGFFMAMANWQLGKKNDARSWLRRAESWADQLPDDEELIRFRKEATALLASGE